MYLIREMPAAERPRERLMKYGAENLGTAELLAILLRTGTKDVSVLEVASGVLHDARTASGLKDLTLSELASRKGVGMTKAIVLQAALELGKRALADVRDCPRITTAKEVFQFVRDELAPLKQEVMIALYLDAKLQLVAKKTLFIGSLNQSLVHPREAFKYAVKYSAHQFILVHNHPSGDPEPSAQDLEVTVRFREIGEMMQIKLADHVIVANDRYVSIFETLKR
ncbi:MAG: DNA repair protein RadC [bacterium]